MLQHTFVEPPSKGRNGDVIQVLFPPPLNWLKVTIELLVILLCIREILSANLRPDVAILTQVFRSIRRYLQVNAEVQGVVFIGEPHAVERTSSLMKSDRRSRPIFSGQFCVEDALRHLKFSHQHVVSKVIKSI
jgi:hypothetical protein